MSVVNEKFIYELFSEVYYRRIFRDYEDSQASVTQAVQCLLKSFFERKIKRALMDSKVVILSFGSLVHEALRVPLEKRGFKSESEGVQRVNGVDLYGHTDALRDDCLIEHKTVTRLPHAPLIHHFRQTNAYMHIFGVPRGYINYVHKPSGTITLFPIEPYEGAFQWVALRAVRLCYCLKHNTMPEPEPSWLCRYCEYIDLCPKRRG